MAVRTADSLRNTILISPMVGFGVPQYSSFALSRKWLALTYSMSLYGPLPTAWRIEASCGWPLNQFGGTTGIFTSRLGRMASGARVVMSTVRSSTFVADAPPRPYSSIDWPGLSLSAIDVTRATTASEL